MTYVKQTWLNGIAGSTPISADRLNYIETGIETASISLDAIADAAYQSVQRFGAIGDGLTHPLSEGYGTLPIAQNDYPHATSLTQELDWAAAQKAINNLPANGGIVLFEDGDYLMGDATNTLEIGDKKTTFTGSGRGSCSITSPLDTALITPTGPFTSGGEGRLRIEKMTLKGNGTGSKVFDTTGISLVEAEITASELTVKDFGSVAFTFGQSVYYWSVEHCYFLRCAGAVKSLWASDGDVHKCQFVSPQSAPWLNVIGPTVHVRRSFFAYGDQGTGTEPDILLNSSGTDAGYVWIDHNKFGAEGEINTRVKIRAYAAGHDTYIISSTKITDNNFGGIEGQTAIQISNPHRSWIVKDNEFDDFLVQCDDTFTAPNNIWGGSTWRDNVVQKSNSTSTETNSIPFTNGGKGFTNIDARGRGKADAINSHPLTRETPGLRNRIVYSEDFTSGFWFLNGITPTMGQADPLGGTGAGLLTRANATGSENIQIAINTTGMLTADGAAASGGNGRLYVSFWAKAGTLSSLICTINDATSASIADEEFFFFGGAWKRRQMVFNGLDPAHTLRVSFYPGSVAQMAGTIYLFGVQVSDYDSDYVKTSGTVYSDTTVGARFQRGVEFKSKISATAISTFADNAAAVAGGLAVGTMYKTATGEVRIVI